MRSACSRRSPSGLPARSRWRPSPGSDAAQALARAARRRASAGLGQDAGDGAAAGGLARRVLARGLQTEPDFSAGLARLETRSPASARMVADRMARGRARADEILALDPA